MAGEAPGRNRKNHGAGRRPWVHHEHLGHQAGQCGPLRDAHYAQALGTFPAGLERGIGFAAGFDRSDEAPDRGGFAPSPESVVRAGGGFTGAARRPWSGGPGGGRPIAIVPLPPRRGRRGHRRQPATFSCALTRRAGGFWAARPLGDPDAQFELGGANPGGYSAKPSAARP